MAHTRQRRGAIEHYYRAVGRVRITDKAWAQVPDIIKNAMISATLDQAVRYVSAAAATGGFDRRDANVSRRGMVLDKQGFAELATAAKELMDRAYNIEGESARRIAASNHEDGEINAGLVLMLFEAPPAYAEVPPGEHAPRRRSSTRAKQSSKA